MRCGEGNRIEEVLHLGALGQHDAKWNLVGLHGNLHIAFVFRHAARVYEAANIV